MATTLAKLQLLLQVGLVLFLTSTAMACQDLKASSKDQCLNKTLPCGFCSKKNISVTIIVQNRLQNPKFDLETTITQRRRPLLYFLEAAADKNPSYRFNASYWGTMGFMVDSINHVSANVTKETYWEITSITEKERLACGVSNYLPLNKEKILFNFTQGYCPPASSHTVPAVDRLGQKRNTESHFQIIP